MTSFLERLTDLEAKASPGPWRFDGPDAFGDWQFSAPNAGRPVCSNLHSTKGLAPSPEDVALIVFLRNAVPEVKALIEAARRNVELSWVHDHSAAQGRTDELRQALDALNRLETHRG